MTGGIDLQLRHLKGLEVLLTNRINKPLSGVLKYEDIPGLTVVFNQGFNVKLARKTAPIVVLNHQINVELAHVVGLAVVLSIYLFIYLFM